MKHIEAEFTDTEWDCIGCALVAYAEESQKKAQDAINETLKQHHQSRSNASTKAYGKLIQNSREA